MSDVTLNITDATPIYLEIADQTAIDLEITGGGGGSGSTSNLLSAVAGENISMGRVVIIISGEAFYFQPSDSSHAGRTLGITKNAALTGENISIALSGEVTDSSFSSFDDLVLWADDDGQIQTTIPTSGILQKVGYGIGSESVIIDFSVQIQLI